MGEMRTFYVTKYALTKGIKCEALRVSASDELACGDSWSSAYRIGRDCFDSWEEAHKDAEKRRKKQIASLRKQIKKLQAKTFEEPSS